MKKKEPNREDTDEDAQEDGGNTTVRVKLFYKILCSKIIYTKVIIKIKVLGQHVNQINKLIDLLAGFFCVSRDILNPKTQLSSSISKDAFNIHLSHSLFPCYPCSDRLFDDYITKKIRNNVVKGKF